MGAHSGVPLVSCAVVLAALLVPSCSQTKTVRQWQPSEFTALTSAVYQPTKAAERNQGTEQDLNASGYVQIGILRINRTEPLSEANAHAALRVEAGTKGGEVYRLETLNGAGFGTTTQYITTCYSVQRDTYGKYECTSKDSSTKTGVMEALKVTTASVWRRDPARAEADRDWWCLKTAMEVKDLPRLERLLKEGANPNARPSGQPPLLLMSVYSDDLPSARVLVAAGASATATDRYGSTPLGAVSRSHDPRYLELLATLANVNVRLSDGLTPLKLASQASGPPNPDQVRRVTHLLKLGADSRLALRDGGTALHIAAQARNVDVVQALLAAGAAVDALDGANETPLYRAAQRGNGQVAEALLARGANPNAARFNGYTPLMMAAVACDADTVRVLLDRGAEVNAATKEGETALRQAAGRCTGDPPGTNRGLKAVVLLIERGANVNAKHSLYKTTALDVAVSNKNNLIAEELRKRGGLSGSR